MMTDELTVVWCGSMRDVYLCVREPSRVQAVSPDRRLSPRPARIAVAQILPTDQDEAMTMQEIKDRSGVTHGAATQELFRLRQFGQLGWCDRPVPGSGHVRRAYWRMEAA